MLEHMTGSPIKGEKRPHIQLMPSELISLFIYPGSVRYYIYQVFEPVSNNVDIENETSGKHPPKKYYSNQLRCIPG
jgi:hypothetical protein